MQTVKSFSSFSTSHNAFIHDIAYDFYGKRLATCSSDKRIKVWDQQGGKWTVTAEIQDNLGSVFKLSWAHPEFGQILASCSADGIVHIYEEQTDRYNRNLRSFPRRGRLVDSKLSVKDVRFAPRHLGLKLATGSQDGTVRVYDAPNLMNLVDWQLSQSFPEGKGEPANTLCWNPSPFDAPMLVVGTGNAVRIWEYQEQFRKWQNVHTLPGHTDVVHHVDWAPQMGRSYHLIATACKDGYVRVFKIHPDQPENKAVELVTQQDAHKTSVWRVSWNVTGTVLASTGDDGTARLWKSDFRGNFSCKLLAKNATAQEIKSNTSGRSKNQVQDSQQRTMSQTGVFRSGLYSHS